MRRTLLFPGLVASLVLSCPAVADTEVDELKRQLRRLEQRIVELEVREARIEKQGAHRTLGALEEARAAEPREGIATGISFTAVAQKPGSVPAGSTPDHSELNYRGDVTVAVPLQKIGEVEQQLFGHVRFGQGAGVNGIPAFSAPNATAFSAQDGAAGGTSHFRQLGRLDAEAGCVLWVDLQIRLGDVLGEARRAAGRRPVAKARDHPRRGV